MVSKERIVKDKILDNFVGRSFLDFPSGGIQRKQKNVVCEIA